MNETPRGGVDDREKDIPDRFGCYRVEALVGVGGMGKVYRALDEALNRHVAIKTLLPTLAADPEFVARFKREAQSAAALNHPNITQIYAIGQEGDMPFFAMELIRGRSLDSMVKEQGALDPIEATRYIIQAAQGLRHAAQKDLIHRDIKPANLMLTEDGLIKITDFGLAKVARAESQLTVTGDVLGSPGYISPEQAQGTPLDMRTDIYSLGATFYNIVTGKMPFDAPTAVAMIMKHLSEPVRSPRALNPAVPYPLGAAIQKMMAKRPQERFADYDILIRELERAVSTPSPRAGARPAGTAANGADVATVKFVAAGVIAPRVRPSRTAARPAPAADQERRSFPWLPAGLVAILGVLIIAGVHRQMAGSGDEPALEPSRPLGTVATAAPVSGAAQETPSRPPPGKAGLGFTERLRETLTGRSRANLRLVSNDHEFLPNGGLRVIGTVKNAGGTIAKDARVRVRILLQDGEVAAQESTPLDPDILGPDEIGVYDISFDYSGSLATIRAELHWTD